MVNLTLHDDGRLLHATVQGSGRGSYQTVVRAHPAPHGVPTAWAGHCTCYGGAAAPPRMRLRPVTPGKADRWIRTGVSWRELQSGYGPVKVRPDTREAVCAILAAFRGRQPAYVSSYGEAQVHLDDLGHLGWRLLSEAQEAGVALLSASPSGQAVQLAEAPASVVLDVRRPEAEGDAEITVAVRLPGEADLRPTGPSLVGTPAHGLFQDGPGRLLLASFDRALDLATERLLQQASLRIQHAEINRR